MYLSWASNVGDVRSRSNFRGTRGPQVRQLLEVSNLTKEYTTPRGPLTILSGITFSLSRGDALSIMGPSGSGKSTLLYILGTLESPTSGIVSLDGQNPFQLPQKELALFRNKTIGFVFQEHCLLPQCTVLENVLIPTLVAESEDQYIERARSLLEQVRLSDRLDHRPAELSGGERQRVALARALIRNPLLLLCDEPTGNLDHQCVEMVASLLVELHQRQQTILIVVTHNPALAGRFPIRFQLVAGQIPPHNRVS